MIHTYIIEDLKNCKVQKVYLVVILVFIATHYMMENYTHCQVRIHTHVIMLEILLKKSKNGESNSDRRTSSINLRIYIYI